MLRRAITIEPVENGRSSAEFVALPYRLYARDPRWVAPLRSREKDRWNPRRNPSLRSRRSWRFLARREGQVVGRIAAFVDAEFATRWLPGAGFFGFFECEDDLEVARLLFKAAESVLSRAGVRHVIGPIQMSTHDEVGLLVEGFEAPPTLHTPYNPPSYRTLLSVAGYVGRDESHAYEWRATDRPAERMRRIVARAERRSKIRLRPIDPKRWEEECRALHTLHNEAFAGVWGFVPMTWEEFAARAARVRPYVDPALTIVAEEEGVPVGFALTLPDLNQALAGLDGKLLPFGWLRLRRRVPKIRAARSVLLGVRPDRLARGVGARLGLATIEAGMARGYERSELALVHASNRGMRHVLEAFGCPPVRTYRLYEKSL